MSDEASQEEVVLLETNIDSMTTEIYGYVMEQLFAAGAKDVFLTPVIMKKNRPGIVLSVLADPRGKSALLDIIFRETPTLGVRVLPVVREVLHREESSVSTPWGDVRVKRSEWNGQTRATPEYEDCAAIAREHGVPIRRVYEEVSASALTLPCSGERWEYEGSLESNHARSACAGRRRGDHMRVVRGGAGVGRRCFGDGSGLHARDALRHLLRRPGASRGA